MGKDRMMPHAHDFQAALTDEFKRCQTSYRDLSERHATLDSILPLWPEGTGIIYEMARLEKAMAGWRKRMAEITAILRGADPEESVAR